MRRRSNRKNISNTTVQRSMALHEPRNVSLKIYRQLSVAKNKQKRNLDRTILSSSRKFLITKSAHEWPPALECFAGLLSHPYNLYRMISFDKLDLMDLGIIWQ